MHFYLYQITNKLNGKIYVGVHKTKNLDDGYMGSGKVIRLAIEKHGIENFTKDILETFETAEAMYAREKEIVTDEFLLKEEVYNLRRGGLGGFDHLNDSSINHLLRVQKAGKKTQTLHPEIRINWNKSRTQAFKIKLKENDNKIWWDPTYGFKGKHHTEETKKKMSEKAKKRLAEKDKNPMFEKCWIYHELIGNKTCKKDLLPLYIEQGWFKGRKL